MPVAFEPVPAQYQGTAPSMVWYAYRTNKNGYGITRSTQLPGNAVQTVFIGIGHNLIDIATHFATATSNALKAIGAPAVAQDALIAQLDSGAVLHNPSYVQATPNKTKTGTTVKSDKPTQISSEAVPTNIIPSPIDPNVGNSNLAASLSGISGFFSLIGSLAFWKGIGLVLAGAGILVFAALEIKGMTM